MRTLMIVLVTLGIVVQQAEAKDYIKVGSWNIENLGQRGGQNRFAMAEYLQLAGLDVLALQEIHDTDGAGPPYRNLKLDQVVELLNEQKGQNWQYELFPKRVANETARLCGVAWNSARVDKLGDAFKIPVDHEDGLLWDRHPYAVKFQAKGGGKNDFVVIAIHMKSNRVDPDDPLGPVARRAREAEALADVFESVTSHFEDEDIVILGDTNCLTADEDALTTLSGLGLRDLNSKEASTYVSSPPFDDDDIGPPFDHIFVPDEQPEFMYSRQVILQPADRRAHEKALSDHLLVMTPVQVMNDDDGPTPTPVTPAVAAAEMSANAAAYYAGIGETDDGDALKESLHRLIRNNHTFTYRQLWDELAFTDEAEGQAGKVVMFYTGWLRSEDDHGGAPDEWNREHVWAKSKGDFATRPGAGTDLHHIRPTDVSVNGARGSLSFDTGGAIYSDPDGPTTNRRDDDSWEPRDEVKGDVARMLFYMAVRYDDDSLDLELIDETVPQQSNIPRIGKLSTLLRWHHDDPVSPFERRRNDRIHQRQLNRNPFIDRPDWVSKIWGGP